MTTNNHSVPGAQDTINRRDILRGLMYMHNRANSNTLEAHQANASVFALTELLLEKGVIDREAFEARREETAQQLQKGYVDRGMAVTLQQFPYSKYDFDAAANINCASRIALCKAACCKLPFALSKEDVQEGVVHWNLGQPYMIAQDENGYCIHKKEESCQCSIYHQRPIPCRGYDCRDDKRIWLDFNKQIVNPKINEADWPRCLDDKETTRSVSNNAVQRKPTPTDASEPTIAASNVNANNTSVSINRQSVTPESFNTENNKEPVFSRATLSPKPLQRSVNTWQRAQPDPGNSAADTEHVAIRGFKLPHRVGASSLGQQASSFFARVVRPELRIFGKTWPAYGVFVHLGVFMGIALALTLTLALDLSLAVMSAVATLGVISAIVFAFATKIVVGEERFTFYHYQILVVVVSALFLNFSQQPVLPYVDVILLALGLILAIGRIGCFMAGCCHGRPHNWGVSYSARHADTGFSYDLVGVRLLPIQAIESLWLFTVVATGVLLLLSRQEYGEAMLCYVFAYGAGRFVFEYFRGDAVRPYFIGLSEAQWTSLLLMGAALGIGFAGYLPLQAWHIIVLTCTLLLALVSTFIRLVRAPRFELTHPRHVNEIAQVLNQINSAVVEDQGQIKLGTTSQGINIAADPSNGSASCVEHCCVEHYSFSCASASLSNMAAATLAKLILRLKSATGRFELVRGKQGVFHLFIYPRPFRGEGLKQ